MLLSEIFTAARENTEPSGNETARHNDDNFAPAIIKFNTLFEGRSLNLKMTAPERETFKTALDSIEKNTLLRIQTSRPLQGLLKTRASWSEAQLEQWERAVSMIVAEETNKHPALRDYRAIMDSSGVNVHSIARFRNMPGGADDPSRRPDCGTSTLVEGMVNQKMANHFLSDRAGNYLYVPGMAKFDTYSGSHYFTLTPAGNIIEATADLRHPSPPPYARVYGNVTEENLSGAVLRTEHGSVYAAEWDDINAFRKQAALVGNDVAPSSLRR